MDGEFENLDGIGALVPLMPPAHNYVAPTCVDPIETAALIRHVDSKPCRLSIASPNVLLLACVL